MFLKPLAVIGLLLGASAAAWAVTGARKAEPVCLTGRLGETRCVEPGQGVIIGSAGVATCGPGPCVVDGEGKAFCAREPDQTAVLRDDGRAICPGGCVRASADYCLKPDK